MNDEDGSSGRRFGGVERLYGERAVARFARARVCVVGVGGVGSWTVEALARSGIGGLILVDLDHVAESNINRQLPALSSTLGKAKVGVLAERAADINPRCRLETIEDFVAEDNLESLLGSEFDWIIDCIDAARAKAALIAHARRCQVPIVTVGGAGGRIDPTRLRATDLSRAEQDRLLARTRKRLRQHYGFPHSPRRRFGVPAVWSTEPRKGVNGGVDTPVSGLNCAGFGSTMPVTATFGLVAAAIVLNKLAEDSGQ